VASIAAGREYGVASGAELVCVKIVGNERIDEGIASAVSAMLGLIEGLNLVLKDVQDIKARGGTPAEPRTVFRFVVNISTGKLL